MKPLFQKKWKMNRRFWRNSFMVVLLFIVLCPWDIDPMVFRKGGYVCLGLAWVMALGSFELEGLAYLVVSLAVVCLLAAVVSFPIAAVWSIMRQKQIGGQRSHDESPTHSSRPDGDQ